MNVINEKPKFVAFGDKKVEREFESLKEGHFQDTQLFGFIERAIVDLKATPACGIKIPKRLWPDEYLIKYEITNLWKYDMPNGWRLVYTIQTSEV